MGSRDKVLEAAASIFAKVGYQACSVDDILEAARVAPSNFYYHFKSKEELGFEVLEGYFERYRQQVAPIFVNRSLAAPEKLERVLGLFVKKISENGCCGGCPLGNLAQELSDTHPGFRKRLGEFFEECIEGICGVVREGIRAGHFKREADPRASAYMIFGSIQGGLLLAKSMKKVEPLEKGFRQTIALLKE